MIRFTKITHDVRNLFPGLTSYFSHRPDIQFAYIFCSYGLGKEKPLCDIDIAVYLTDEIPRQDFFNIRLDPISDISGILKTDEIDLVILNNAEMLLMYQTVYSGTIIFERDKSKRIDFETRVRDRYFDMGPVRSVQREYFKQHVQEGKIFG